MTPVSLPHIGKYKIVKLIKSGEITDVFEAVEEGFESPVAIKILRKSQNRIPVVVKRFKREAMTALSLHHDNIVPMYDIGHENETHFYVMKRIDGFNLGEIRAAIRSKSRIEETYPAAFLSAFEKVEFVLGIASQVLNALSYAHEQGIIHRDIKPTNIMVDQRGKAWVSDFGTAKLTEGISETLTTTGCNLGSFRYASPELICANEEECGAVDRKSDLYSVGVVFFEFITGQVPMSSSSNRGTNSFPKAITPMPKSVEQILRKASEPDARKRFESAELFCNALTNHQTFIDNPSGSSILGSIVSRFFARKNA